MPCMLHRSPFSSYCPVLLSPSSFHYQKISDMLLFSPVSNLTQYLELGLA